MKWIGPILLTRSLANAPVPQGGPITPENPHMIKLTKTRAKNDDSPPLERKLTFSPFGLTTLTRADFEGARAGYWDGAMDVPFDPTLRVECEIADYLLQLQEALLSEVLNPPTSTRKRKPQGEAQDSSSSPTKRPREDNPASLTSTGQRPQQSVPQHCPSSSTTKHRKGNVASALSTPVRAASFGSAIQTIDLNSDSDEDLLAPFNFHSPDRIQGSRPRSPLNRPTFDANNVNAFDSSGRFELEDDDPELREALKRSLEDVTP